MPTRECRECSAEFELEEGVGRFCNACYYARLDTADEPLDVWEAMQRRRGISPIEEN